MGNNEHTDAAADAEDLQVEETEAEKVKGGIEVTTGPTKYYGSMTGKTGEAFAAPTKGYEPPRESG